ncbi:MAG: nicotinate-nucleotide--dimethylbenzimidazole phosphoribosyltransferase, partial [Rhizobiaceae bacterium]
TAQMVANFASNGAAINQISRSVGAGLRVIPLQVETPTRDFTTGPALDEAGFLAAVSAGYDAVADGTDLLCLGEMGIGNTTPAAAISAALVGGDPAAWTGRGTGVDDAGLSRKAIAIRKGFEVNRAALSDPLGVAASLGGRELAAILGATLAARHKQIPVLLDGFVCTAAAAPLARLAMGGLAHCQAAHVSAEYGHRALLMALGLSPILDLGMRLGEGSGAALAVGVMRGALACHTGMASFAEAGVSDKS